MRYLLTLPLLCSCEMGLSQYSIPIEDVKTATTQISTMLDIADSNHDGKISGVEWLVLIQAINDFALEMKND